MKRLLLFLTALSAFGQAPTVTSVSFDNISHSVVLVHFNASASWNYLRIRYIQSPGTCTSGTGGTVEVTAYVPGNATLTTNMRQPLGGLLPNTTYQVCPEISSDGGTWSSGAGALVTTLPLPAVHPALPVPPATFNTDYPDTTGYAQINVSSDCSDLLPAMQTAVSGQLAHGTVINIPAGAVCNGQYYLSQFAPDVVRFDPSVVNATANTITLPNHGYSEGQALIFGTYYACLPGVSVNGCNQGPIVPGTAYYAHVVDSNTIQLYANAPLSSGGTLITLPDSGNQGCPGGNCLLVVKWPRPLNWIIVRTATPDNQFVPEHTRLAGPPDANGVPSPPTQWLPKMAVLKMPNTYMGINNGNTLFATNDQDGGIMSMNANIRFVGVEFTYAPSEDAPTSSNAIPHFQLVSTSQWNQNIIFDRCYFHGLPPPDRVARAFWWNGKNQAIVDSYIDNMQFYHPNYEGMQVSVVDSNHFTIAPGKYNFGSGLITLPGTVTVTTSGNTGSNLFTGYVYFTSNKQLIVSLPPGVTGVSCAGYSPCLLVTQDSSNTLGWAGGPPSVNLGVMLWVDPIFSSDGTTANQNSLWLRNTEPMFSTNLADNYPAQRGGGPGEIGNLFKSTQNGYILGARFYKVATDIGVHTAHLWNASRGLLASATFSGETATGWQTVYFGSPVSITAGTSYYITYSYSASGSAVVPIYDGNQQNGGIFDPAHTPLYVPGHYAQNSGANNYQENFPKNWLGNIAVGQLALIGYNNTGSYVAVMQDTGSNPFSTEGCQCMVGGIGPGPYKFQDNLVQGTGVVWHHDDSGGLWAPRSDYTYIRNYFQSPLSQMIGSPQSDGLRYFHRQPLEWKAGKRIFISGNIFDTTWTEQTPYGEFIDFSNPQGDIDIQNNTFKHGASLIFPASTITGGGIKWELPIRFRFQNNLVSDINGFAYCAYGYSFCPPDGAYGVLLAASQGNEDWTINHNTIVANAGKQPSLMWMSETRVEGVNFTNNILFINGGPQSNGIGPGSVCGLSGSDPNCAGAGTSCWNLASTSPKAVAECALQNYLFKGNLLTGNVDAATMASYWPDGTYTNGLISNYIPSDPTNLGAIGWFQYSTSTAPSNDYRLKSTSAFISGASNHGVDGRDVGADMDALRAAAGAVTLIGTPNSSITSNAAAVSFVAPDSQGCPVDVSASDPNIISGFTRFADPGGSDRSRTIAITGLSGGTLYYYRVNCAVEKPLGQFRTR